LKFWITSVKIGADEAFLYLPLTREPASEELEEFSRTKLSFLSSISSHRKRNLFRKTFLVSALLMKLSEISPCWKTLNLTKRKPQELPTALLQTHSNIKTVLKPLTPVMENFGSGNLRSLQASRGTETIHREYGCRYKVDLSRAYFTPRLSTERSRILSQG